MDGRDSIVQLEKARAKYSNGKATAAKRPAGGCRVAIQRLPRGPPSSLVKNGNTLMLHKIT